MKMVLIRNEDGTKAKYIRLAGIMKGKGRAELLAMFAVDPELKYAETNCQRYTVSDIYAGRLGQAI